MLALGLKSEGHNGEPVVKRTKGLAREQKSCYQLHSWDGRLESVWSSDGVCQRDLNEGVLRVICNVFDNT